MPKYGLTVMKVNAQKTTEVADRDFETNQEARHAAKEEFRTLQHSVRKLAHAFEAIEGYKQAIYKDAIQLNGENNFRDMRIDSAIQRELMRDYRGKHENAFVFNAPTYGGHVILPVTPKNVQVLVDAYNVGTDFLATLNNPDHAKAVKEINAETAKYTHRENHSKTDPKKSATENEMRIFVTAEKVNEVMLNYIKEHAENARFIDSKNKAVKFSIAEGLPLRTPISIGESVEGAPTSGLTPAVASALKQGISMG